MIFWISQQSVHPPSSVVVAMVKSSDTAENACQCVCECECALSVCQSDQVTTAVTRATTSGHSASLRPTMRNHHHRVSLSLSLSAVIERPLDARLAVASLPSGPPPVACSLAQRRACKPTHLTTLVADRFRALTVARSMPPGGCHLITKPITKSNCPHR